MNWKTIERPGYFGKERDELYSEWNSKFGEGKWRISYEWGNLVILGREALQVYEDGYYEFFKSNSLILEWLVRSASDIWDTAITNIMSKFDYEYQETANNHIYDIAIRRAVMRLGRWFKGNKLIHVRGKGTSEEKLSPHMVPFHRPELIYQGRIKDYGNNGCWWRELGIEKSIEEFYQQNKILQVRK